MFKVGDRVRFRKDSEFCESGSCYNPRLLDGTVVEVVNSFGSYAVKWDNGNSCRYYEEVLELAGKVLFEI